MQVREAGLIVTYDAQKCDWDEVLRKAWASRPPGEVGTIIAIERGGMMHRDRELMKKHGDHHEE
jgi:hypothetical protein